MAENRFAQALIKLATSDENKSDTARLRAIVSNVEEALSSGVTHAAIVEALNAEGFKITMRSFQSALYRIRKGKPKAAATAAAPAVQAAAPSPGRPAGPAPAPAAPKKRGPLDPPPAPAAGLNFAAAAEQVADHFVTAHDSDLVKRMKEREQKK